MEEEKLSTVMNEQLNKEKTATDVIEARPISYKKPESNTIYAMDEKLTMEERKQGWIEQPRKRVNGREDKYYYHLKSDEMCRSLIEVHDFIKHGISIRSFKKMKKKQQDDSPAKRIRGSSLLKKNIVGTYNLQTKTVSKQETPKAVEESPQLPLDDNVVDPVEESPQQPLHNVVNPVKEKEASSKNKDKECNENPMTEGECTSGQVNKSEDTTSALDNANVPYIVFDFIEKS